MKTDDELPLVVFIMCLMCFLISLLVTWTSYNMAYLAINGKDTIHSEEMKK